MKTRLPLALLAALVTALPAASAQEPDVAERFFRVLERRYRETPDPTDPRAAAARLGFDRDRIFPFVKGLAWEPYSGILRDASGTLLAGGGNSIDRALLLQTMLETAGEKTRLVRCDVAEADGARLLETFGKRAEPPAPATDLKALALELGVDSAALEARVAANRRKDKDLLQEILEASKTEAARLSPLVGPLPGLPPKAPRDHVWVQVWDAPRKAWIDLDPSPVELPHAAPKPVTPQELSVQRNSLTIRIVMNRKSGLKVEPVVLLNVPSEPSAIAGKPVQLVMMPKPGELPAADKLRDLDEMGRIAAYRAVRVIRPGVILDGKTFGGRPFDLSGRTYDVDSSGRIGPAKAVGGAVTNAFGGAFGGGDSKEPGPSGVESVMLEVVLKMPGIGESVHRRPLYLSERPAEGPALLPFLRMSFLVETAPLPPGERRRREEGVLVRMLPSIRDLQKDPAKRVHPHSAPEVSSLLLHFADLRRRTLAGLAEGTPFLQDRPGLCAETRQIGVDEKAGRLVLRRSIDIFESPVHWASGDRTLRYGLAETALECLLAGRVWAGNAGPSAWATIERARLEGGAADVKERGGRKEVRWSPGAWWSVDPVSGNCVGRVPTGAGQALIEEAWDNAHEVCDMIDAGLELGGAMGDQGMISKQAGEMSDLASEVCTLTSGDTARNSAKTQEAEFRKKAMEGILSAFSGGEGEGE
jgi:transglutaminase-like putative cysteine protease